MAISASGLYGLTIQKMFYNTTGFSLDSETVTQGLLVTDSYTPNFDTDAFRSNTTNEVTGTGYTAGGKVLTSTTTTISGGIISYDHADLAWTASTISNAMALIGFYNTGTTTTSQLIYLLDFVTAVSTVSGTLTVQINAGGVFSLDYTP